MPRLSRFHVFLLCFSSLFFLVPPYGAYAQQDPVANAPAEYETRLKVVNNCGVNAWMWVTPGATAEGAKQANFWGSQTVNKGRKVCKGANKTKTTCDGNYNYMYKFVFPAGNSKRFHIPKNGSAGTNIYFALNCANNTSTLPEIGTCVIGGRPGENIQANLFGSNPLFEATWGCNKTDGTNCAVNPSKTSEVLTAVDWFDLSVVDAYSIPMGLEANQSKMSGKGCKAGDYTWNGSFDLSMLDLDSCPTEYWSTMWSDDSSTVTALQSSGVQLVTNVTDGQKVNCAAPRTWISNSYLGTPGGPGSTGTDFEYLGCSGSAGTRTSCLKGPLGDGSKTVAETNYVQHLKAMGVNVYTWAYDDSYGDTQCNYGLDLTLTLCPGKAGQIPYNDQKWNYDSSTNTCTSSSSGKYDSYFDCISVNSRYTQQGTGDSSSHVVYCIPDPDGKYANYDECRGRKPHSHTDHQNKTGVHGKGQKTNSTISKTGTPILVATLVKPINGTGYRVWQANAQNSTYTRSVIIPAHDAAVMTSDMLDRVEIADSADAYGTFTSEFWEGGPQEARSLYAFQPYSFDASLNATAGISMIVKWDFKGTGSSSEGDIAGRKVGDIEVYKYMQKYQQDKTAGRWTIIYGDGETTNWSGMVDKHGNPTQLDDGSAFFTTYDDYGTILPIDYVFQANTTYYLWALIQNHGGDVEDISTGSYDLDNSTTWVFDPPRIMTDVKAPGVGSSSSGCMLNPVAGFASEWLLLLLVPIIGIVRNRVKK